MKLLVRKLSRNTTEASILDLFSEYAKVEYCTLVLDKATGKSKGFAFVEINKIDDAKQAISKLDGSTLDGAKIRVKQADDE